MSMTCTVCQHPRRKEIEREFIRGRATRAIALRYEVSRGSVQQHVTHVARDLLRARTQAGKAAAEDLLQVAGEALVAARGLFDLAVKTGNGKSWASAVTAMQRHVELMAKIEGRITETQVIVVLESPAWQQVEDRIFAALESMPRARDLVAQELLRLTSPVDPGDIPTIDEKDPVIP